MKTAIHRYQLLLRILSVIYFGLGFLYFFFPEQLLFLFNLPTELLNFMESDRGLLVPIARVIGGSYFLTLCALALLSSERPTFSGFATLHVFSLFVLCIAAFWTYFNERAEFVLMLFGVTSAVLALAITSGVLASHWATRRSKKYETREEAQTPPQTGANSVPKEPVS